jgi:spore germination protein YaaH
MTNTELQTLAQKKYNKVMMGNGSDIKLMRLYNVRAILDKENLTEADILMLQHFVNATRQEIDRTAYVANTAVYPSSWGHATTDLRLKITKNAK